MAFSSQTTPSSSPFSFLPEHVGSRETVGLFQDHAALQDAIRDLEGSAFPRQDISVMGSEKDLIRTFGTAHVSSQHVMDNSDTPREAPARPEEQTIGAAAAIGGGTYIGAMAVALASGAVTFPAIIAAAAIGGLGGGTLGALLTRMLGHKYDDHVEDQIKNGGLLLWVRTPDASREELAMSIMEKYGAQHVHSHDIG